MRTPGGAMPVIGEHGPEYIPSRSEVLAQIESLCPEAVIVDEKSDALGSYFIVAREAGEISAEHAEYIYHRKGDSPGNLPSRSTDIYKIYCEGDMAVGGEHVLHYDEAKGRWTDHRRYTSPDQLE